MKDTLLGMTFGVGFMACIATLFNTYEISQLSREMSEQLKREAVLMEAITLLRLDCVKYRYPQSVNTNREYGAGLIGVPKSYLFLDGTRFTNITVTGNIFSYSTNRMNNKQ